MRWISMRNPATKVLKEHKTLTVKIGIDTTPVPSKKNKDLAVASDNFDYLENHELLLSLACFQPLLTTVHCLIKFAQARDIFISDVSQFVKCVHGELARKYLDLATSFGKEDFPEYHFLLKQTILQFA